MKTKKLMKIILILSLVINAVVFGFLFVQLTAGDGFSMTIEGVQKTPLIRYAIKQSDEYSCTVDEAVLTGQIENGTVLKVTCRNNWFPFVAKSHEFEVEGLLSTDMVSRAEFVDQISENFSFVSEPIDILIKRNPKSGIIDSIMLSYKEGIFITGQIFDGNFFKDYGRMIELSFIKPCEDQTECIMGMAVSRKFDFSNGRGSTYVDQESYELNLQRFIDEGYEIIE